MKFGLTYATKLSELNEKYDTYIDTIERADNPAGQKAWYHLGLWKKSIENTPTLE